ncbi:MAG TPA: hypothetical protein VIT91_07290 [Chthoniobacterales bacterium]
MNEPHIPVIGMPGAIGIEAQREPLREPRHGLVGMIVVDRIDTLPPGDGTIHPAQSNVYPGPGSVGWTSLFPIGFIGC